MSLRACSSSTRPSRHEGLRERPRSIRGVAKTGRSRRSSLFVSDDEAKIAEGDSPGVTAATSVPHRTSSLSRTRHGHDSREDMTDNNDSSEDDVAALAAGIDASANRVRRVTRHEGLPPFDLQPRSPALTEAEQEGCIVALQNQIRYTFAIQPSTLRRYLRNNDWSVIGAVEAFRDDEAAARSRTTLLDAFSELPLAHTVETSRLHARTALHRRLNTGEDGGNSLPYTNTALLELLQRNHWVLDHAEEGYHNKNGDLDDITDEYSSLRAPRPSPTEQDARLAAFVSLTSTNSIFAARSQLAEHKWDYARAVDAWRRNHGLPEDRAPKRTDSDGLVHETEPNDGLRYNNANHPPYPYTMWRSTVHIPDDDDSTNAPLSSDAGSDSSLSDADDDDDSGGMDRAMHNDSQSTGCFIEYDRRHAMLYCPDPSKLRVEMIQQGRYKMLTFAVKEKKNPRGSAERKRFRGDGQDGKGNDEASVEFDWSNCGHIRQLNAWCQQFVRPR